MASHAVYFCCTVPEVAFARRYLASCPVKPGLSSPASFAQQRPPVPLKTNVVSISHFVLSVQWRPPACFPVFLYLQAASADELPQNGIFRNHLAVNRQEVVQEFQNTLGLVILLRIPRDPKQQGLRIYF